MSCDVRLAAQSALFGQPEIKLGIIPGFGGTQRLPRLVGENKALEMNLIGDPIGADGAYEYGLVNRVVPDHELLDTALLVGAPARRAGAARDRAVKEVSANGDLDEGIEAEKAGFAAVFQSADGKEGISAFLGKRKPAVDGVVSVARVAAQRDVERLAELIREAALGRRAHRRGHLGAVRHPGLPHARAPGCGRTSTR